MWHEALAARLNTWHCRGRGAEHGDWGKKKFNVFVVFVFAIGLRYM